MTTIEWTHPPGYRGESWNPVTGCTKVSQGCKHCYAERVFPRAYAATGRRFVDVQTHPDRLDAPLRRRAPTCWFVNSMSDLFHEAVSDDFVRAVWTTMARARRHRFIVLTKRADRMCRVLTGWQSDGLTLREGCGAVLPNVWIGVSAEDQATADERVPLLLQTPAAVRLVSLEPLLGPVDLARVVFGTATTDGLFVNGIPIKGTTFTLNALKGAHSLGWAGLDWLIVGGESGPGARPCNVEWVRSIVTQGREAQVACFVKQGGRHNRCAHDQKGGCWMCMPTELKVREYPDAT